MIKAIETRYKGYRFRSRLEARWAVFFDELGIKYKYEEYGFERQLDPTEKPLRWLPDFYLPNSAVWVEVKGGAVTSKDAEKMGALLDWNSDLPFFDGSGSHHKSRGVVLVKQEDLDLYQNMGGELIGGGFASITPGLLLLGEIPEINHGICLHPFIVHNKGLIRTAAQINPSGRIFQESRQSVDMFHAFTGKRINMFHECIDGICEAGGDLARQLFDPSCVASESKFAYLDICGAYQKARSARFEHGECG